jgi:hypothetical protein
MTLFRPQNIRVKVSDVTLVDTQIFDYKVIKGCTYFTGTGECGLWA